MPKVTVRGPFGVVEPCHDLGFGDNVAHLLGAAHTFNPADSQNIRIEQEWRTFSSDIAFSEGGLPPIASSRYGAVQSAGEASSYVFCHCPLAAHLAVGSHRQIHRGKRYDSIGSDSAPGAPVAGRGSLAESLSIEPLNEAAGVCGGRGGSVWALDRQDVGAGVLTCCHSPWPIVAGERPDSRSHSVRRGDRSGGLGFGRPDACTAPDSGARGSGRPTGASRRRPTRGERERGATPRRRVPCSDAGGQSTPPSHQAGWRRLADGAGINAGR